MTPSAETILSQINRPDHWDGWIPTYESPAGFRPFAPRVEDVHLRDIAWGLAYTWRYGGHSNPVITVAEHVVLVSNLIETLWDNREVALAGLLHDACEAYTHDIQAPLRKHIMITLGTGEKVSWMEMERRINLVIFEALGVDPALLDHPMVKAADMLGACFEKRQCTNLHGDWGLPPIPLMIADHQMHIWSPQEAHEALLLRMRDLGLNP